MLEANLINERNRALKPVRLLPFIALAPAALMFSCFAQAEDDRFITALKGGTPTLNMRLRYEEVGVDVPNPIAHEDEATALTLRTRLGYQTGKLGGFDAYGEFEDTHVISGVDDYTPESPGYAVIADPRVTEVNQSFIRYTGSETLNGLVTTYGRQRIIYDNARFVGNVGWRQDEQTYDAAKLDYGTDNFALSAAHISQVNSITPALDNFSDSVLANAKWKSAPGGALTAYGYMLKPKYKDDFDTTDTYGVRYEGGMSAGNVKLLLALEYADQSRQAALTAVDNDVTYSLVEAGASIAGVTVKVAQEVLGSDNGLYGFQTPLATKHAFNGWADKFLVTPAAGLEDRYIFATTNVAGIKLAAAYHQFSADSGGQDYGTETDLVALKKIGPYTVGIKYADYKADTFSVDTDKLWGWAEMSF